MAVLFQEASGRLAVTVVTSQVTSVGGRTECDGPTQGEPGGRTLIVFMSCELFM